MSDMSDQEKSDLENGLKWWVRYGCIPIAVAVIAGLSAIIAVTIHEASAEPSTPDPTYAVVATATNTPTPTFSSTPMPTATVNPTPTPTASPTATPTLAPVPIGQHVVQSGDTLYCIGRAYGTRPDAIAQANSLVAPFNLYPGQVLNIPAVPWGVVPPGPTCARQFDSQFAGPPGILPTLAPPKPAPAGHVYPTPQIIANYMPWYSPNDWSTGCTSDADSPQAGPYNSDDPATIARQIGEARSAGLDGFAVHWATTGDRTDKNFATVLSLSGSTFHSTLVYLGHFFYGTASQSTVVAQLQYLLKAYSGSASFLRMNDKPVILFTDMPRIALEGSQTTPQEAWAAVRAQVDPAHNTLWIAEGLDPSYLDTFDGIYIYKIDHACCASAYTNAARWVGWARQYEARTGQPRYFIGTIQPGWDDLNSANPDCSSVRVPSLTFARDRENGAYYRRTFDAALAANPDMLLVHSYNEWVEGSYIEPSLNFGDFYITLTGQLAGIFRGSR